MRRFVKDALEAQSRAAEEVVRATQHVTEMQNIDKLLPEGVDPVRVHWHAYKSDFTMVFEIEKHDDALKLLKKLPPVEAMYCTTAAHGGITSIVAKERFESRESFHQEFPVAGIHLTFEFIAGCGGTTEVVHWWTRIGAWLIKVECKCKQSYANIQVHGDNWRIVARGGDEPKVRLGNANMISWAGERPVKVNQHELVRGSKRYTIYFDEGTDPEDALYDYDGRCIKCQAEHHEGEHVYQR